MYLRGKVKEIRESIIGFICDGCKAKFKGYPKLIIQAFSEPRINNHYCKECRVKVEKALKIIF